MKKRIKERYKLIFEGKINSVVNEFMEHLRESMEAEKAAGFFSCEVTLDAMNPNIYKSRITSNICKMVPEMGSG